MYKEQLLRQLSQLQMFEKSTLDTIEKLVENSQAKQPERLDVNLRNIVEEKRITTGVHQIFGKIFDKVGFNDVLENLSRKKSYQFNFKIPYIFCIFTPWEKSLNTYKRRHKRVRFAIQKK